MTRVENKATSHSNISFTTTESTDSMHTIYTYRYLYTGQGETATSPSLWDAQYLYVSGMQKKKGLLIDCEDTKNFNKVIACSI